MTPLGKPLVFYLKFMAEMNRIYGHEEGEEPDLTELDDAERVREMAGAVGAAACEQAADFLETCGREIEDHFTALKSATLVRKRKRAFLVRNWYWEAEVNVSSFPNGSFWCGVWITAPPEVGIAIQNGVSGVVVPYIWSASKRGRRTVEPVWNILSIKPRSRVVEGLVEWVAEGSVPLACIPIKAQPPESLDVDRGPLITEVMKTIALIGDKQTRAIAKFLAGLKESDES